MPRIAKVVLLSDCNKDKCFHLPSTTMPSNRAIRLEQSYHEDTNLGMETPCSPRLQQLLQRSGDLCGGGVCWSVMGWRQGQEEADLGFETKEARRKGDRGFFSEVDVKYATSMGCKMFIE